MDKASSGHRTVKSAMAMGTVAILVAPRLKNVIYKTIFIRHFIHQSCAYSHVAVAVDHITQKILQ